MFQPGIYHLTNDFHSKKVSTFKLTFPNFNFDKAAQVIDMARKWNEKSIFDRKFTITTKGSGGCEEVGHWNWRPNEVLASSPEKNIFSFSVLMIWTRKYLTNGQSVFLDQNSMSKGVHDIHSKIKCFFSD